MANTVNKEYFLTSPSIELMAKGGMNNCAENDEELTVYPENPPPASLADDRILGHLGRGQQELRSLQSPKPLRIRLRDREERQDLSVPWFRGARWRPLHRSVGSVRHRSQSRRAEVLPFVEWNRSRRDECVNRLDYAQLNRKGRPLALVGWYEQLFRNSCISVSEMAIMLSCAENAGASANLRYEQLCRKHD